MGFSKIHSGQSYYLEGQVIDVEVDLSRGLHSFTIVGLPDKAVEEAKDRISAAIKNSGFISPKQKNHRVVISLAPADVRKAGSHFDLAMAVGYLLASKDISFDPTEQMFVGELSLDGKIRRLRGVLAVVLKARENLFKRIFIPKENILEVSLVTGIQIIGVENLQEVLDYITNKLSENQKKEIADRLVTLTNAENNLAPLNTSFDSKNLLEEIIGQPMAKRAIQIAAAGGHNILLIGPPGTGKTMLAQTLRELLPKLSTEEIIEVTSIHSIAGTTTEIISDPPFRAPHHTSSYSALIGGGNIPQPGEITLAHRGVLFLDEFPEFDRRVIETLRQPLESRTVNITRAKGSVNFPAHFMLVAAMNPCPCGFKNSLKKPCTCSVSNIARYKKKISGPILDRIDMVVEVGDVEYSEISKNATQKKPAPSNIKQEIKTKTETETQKAISQISDARKKQTCRLTGIRLNSDLTPTELSLHSNISQPATKTLLVGAESFNLSLRSYHRVWRVARTIADIENSSEIKENHVLEAFQYRRGRDF